jgi:hypothetical protein
LPRHPDNADVPTVPAQAMHATGTLRPRCALRRDQHRPARRFAEASAGGAISIFEMPGPR